MNKENAKDYLPLVQALADGKVLQVRRDPGNGHRQWFDLDGTCFDRAADQYRIKPEPREIWVNHYANPFLLDQICDSKEEAERRSACGQVMWQKRYREVLE